MSETLNNKNVGWLLVAVGVIFAVLRFSGFTLASILWPLWVLVPGLAMLYMAFFRDENSASLGWGIPGAVVGGTGAILFALNLTGHWAAWAYAWTLYPLFIGLALQTAGVRTDNEKMVQGGKITANSGLYQLIGFGLFFELLIFNRLAFLDSIFLPLALMGIGAYLLLNQNRVRIGAPRLSIGKRKNEELADPVTGINPKLRREIDAALVDED